MHPKLSSHYLWGPFLILLTTWIFWLVATGTGYWSRQIQTNNGFGAFYTCTSHTDCTYWNNEDVLSFCDAMKNPRAPSASWCDQWICSRVLISIDAIITTFLFTFWLLQIARHYLELFSKIPSKFYYYGSLAGEYLLYLAAFAGFLNMPIGGTMYTDKINDLLSPGTPQYRLNAGFVMNFISTFLSVYLALMLRKFVNPALQATVGGTSGANTTAGAASRA